MSLKESVINGVLWRLLTTFSRRGVTFLVGIILARILGPEAYGTIALLAIFIDISGVLVNGGLGAAMCAGIGAGIFRNPVDAVERCVRVKRVYVPNAHLQDAYETAFLRWKRV